MYRLISIRSLGICSVTFLVCLPLASSTQGAIESRNVLYTYFETGDIPTEEQFSALIDSQLAIVDGNSALVFESGASLSSNTVYSPTGGVFGSVGNQGWDIGHLQDPVVERDSSFSSTLDLGAGTLWPGSRGYLGFSVQAQEPGQPSTTHYGFLQMSVDGPASPDPYAIRIFGVAIETTPDTAISIFQIPEPSTAMLLVLSIGLLRLRALIRPENARSTEHDRLIWP